MATSLNALSMHIGMNTEAVTAGVASIRQQMGRANRIMQMAKTDSDRLTEGTQALAVAFKKGAITAQQHAKGLRFLEERYNRTEKAARGTNMELMSQLPLVGNSASRLSILSSQATSSAAALGGLSAGAAAVAAPLAALVAGAAATAAAIKAANAAVRMMRAEMERLDPTIKSATAMGALVGDVQAFQYAFGQLGGLSGGETEKALTGLQRRIGEAAIGAGEAGVAFRLLGLDARRLAAMAPTKQMEAVARAMKDVENASQRAHIANKLFEESGRKLLPVLAAQSDELEKAKERARDFGIMLNQVQAKGIETANDSLGDLTQMMQGFKTQAAAEFAPLFTTVAQILRDDVLPHAGNLQMAFRVTANSAAILTGTAIDFGNSIAGTAQVLSGDIADGLMRMASATRGEGVARMVSGLQRAREEAARAAEAGARIGGEIQWASDAAEALQKSFSQQTGQLHLQIVAMQQGEAVARRLKLQQEGYNAGQIMQIENQHRMIDRLKAEEKQREKMAKAVKDYFADEKKRVEELTRLGKQVRESVRNPFEIATDEIGKLMALLRTGVIDQATFAKASKNAASGLVSRETPPAIEAIEAGSQEAYKRMVGGIQDEREKHLAKLEEQRVLQAALLAAMQSVDRHIAELPKVGRAR